MTSRMALVQYGPNKFKKVTIPPSKECNDHLFVKKELLRILSEDPAMKCALQVRSCSINDINLQYYEPDFEVYVDVDDNTLFENKARVLMSIINQGKVK